MTKHRSFRLTLPSGRFQFSLGGLFRLQVAFAGVLGTVILLQNCFGRDSMTLAGFAVFAGFAVLLAFVGYGVVPRRLALIPHALITAAVAGIGSVLIASGSSITICVASGLAGSLIGAFVFLGLGWKAKT